jgi:molybdate transport system regulatory protein
MNTLNGHIKTITTDQNISLVKVLAEGHLFHSLILDTPTTSPWLKEDAPIRLLFKETEVMIGLPPLHISVRNQLPCRITAITTGAILCELTLSLTSDQASPQPAASGPVLRSIITRSACESLGLKENQDVIALIKTNEVSLAHD